MFEGLKEALQYVNGLKEESMQTDRDRDCGEDLLQ